MSAPETMNAFATMNALATMTQAADAFRDRLRREPGIRNLPAPRIGPLPEGLQWSNLLLTGAAFRRGHVETFVVPGRLCVLHVCLFPPLDDASPVFGFDMIAGPARVTGLFLDLSPVVEAPTSLRLPDVVSPHRLAAFTQPRVLPSWAGIFSPDMLAVRPVSQDEVEGGVALALDALEGWLAAPRPSAADQRAVIAGQAAYVAGQRHNEHTWRMLAGFIGPARARRFIDEVLFPAIPDPASGTVAGAAARGAPIRAAAGPRPYPAPASGRPASAHRGPSPRTDPPAPVP